MNEENGTNSVVSHTSTLKQKLAKDVPEELSFYPVGCYVVVHSSDMTPCDYTVSTLKGYGLRNNNLIRAFSRMMKGKQK